jgi:hypothetical protein
MRASRASRARVRRRGDDMAIDVVLSLVFATIALLSLAALVTEIVVKAAG